MNLKLFLNHAEHHWTEVSKSVTDALVIMDDASAECLHWHGGLKRLLENGAVGVENFSPFVVANSKVFKVVFILMSSFTGETQRTLTVIMRANKFKECVVFSSLPSKCHSDGSDTSNQAFMVLEKQLCTWMENKNSFATVRHIPLFCACISQNVFIMPSFSQLFSILQCGLTEMNSKRTDNMLIKSVPLEMQLSIKHLAYSLTSLLDTFQVKGDFFSMGPLSYILSSELENISQQQKKAHSSKASVVIVDRLLDLAGPLSQSYENMLDKILLAMPHIPGHKFDVCVPMDDLAACESGSVFGRPLLAPGCIAHKSNFVEQSTLNAILCKKPREILIELNRHFVDCAATDGLKVDINSQLTPDTFRQRILSVKQNRKFILKFNGFLQQVTAVIRAMEHSSSNSVDNLSAIERALLEYLATSPEEVLNSIMQMISEKEEMNYKMEDILIFLAFFYMLSGETDVGNESAMQATLMEELFQGKKNEELLSLFVDGEHDDEHVLNTVRTLFSVFKRLGTMRKKFKKYSLFMNVAKPRPRDNPVVFIIILGGITASEIKVIQEIATQKKGTEIILGCMGVLMPYDVVKELGLIVKELVNYNVEEENTI